MNASLPAGERIATMQITPERLFDSSPDFSGCIVIESNGAKGFILAETGTPIAAAYVAEDLKLSGKSAYEEMVNKDSLTCALNKYSSEELDEAKNLVLDSFGFDMSDLTGDTESAERSFDDLLSEKPLESILKQPGVKAVSVFFEGFALHSVGDADFEQVAALSEDLVRSANQITSDLGMDSATQLILETPEGKLIISPVGDLFICILAENDSQLGLIRLAIQTIKHDLGEA